MEDDSDSNIVCRNKKYGREKAIVALLFCASVWGLEYVAVKDVLTAVSPYAINFIRFFAAFLLLFVVFHKKVRGIGKYEFISGGLSGVAMAFGHIAQAIGLTSVEAGVSAFLANTTVVIVPLLTWILYKKRPENKIFVSAVFCLLGIGLLSFTGGGDGFTAGSLFSLADAVFFSVQLVCVQYFSKKANVIGVTLVQFFTVALVTMGIALAKDGTVLVPLEAFGLGIWIRLIFIIAVSTVICQALCNQAVKSLSASQVDITLAAETVFAGFFGWLLLEEAITPKLFAGGILILCSILIVETSIHFTDVRLFFERKWTVLNHRKTPKLKTQH